MVLYYLHDDILLFHIDYAFGEKGTKSCPNGYKYIADPDMCNVASNALGLVYQKDYNILDPGNACVWIPGKGPPIAFINSGGGRFARRICQRNEKGKYHSSNSHLYSPFQVVHYIKIFDE